MPKDVLHIHLLGAFRIRAPDARDVTPPGQNARGLVALLVTAPDGRRGRRWLEAHLWSNRPQEQASGSLRQTLLELRKSLGPYADRIGSDRSAIWIDRERIVTDLEQSGGRGAPGQSFLEDIDVRDEGFEEWLREMRQALEETPVRDPGLPPARSPMGLPALPPTTEGLVLRTLLPETGGASEKLAARIIADQMAIGLGERLSATRFAATESARADGTADLEIRCDLAEGDGASMIFIQVLEGRNGEVVYSGHERVAGRASDAISAELVQGLVHNASRGVTSRLPFLLDPDRPEVAAIKHFNEGMDWLARFDASGFEEANQHFQLAHETDGNGLYLAWRAFVRMAQLLEKVGGDSQERIDEINALIPETLERAPDNGLAVALVALTRIMLEDDLGEPAELAARALRWNQRNLFARQTLAVAYGATGNTERAYSLSRSCQQARPDDELSHLWDLYHALVCISAGRLDEARLAAERSSRSAPTFLAPRRQLIALFANAGNLDAATHYLSELRSLEQDFSLDRYLNDPDYPVLTVRKAGLLQPVKSLLTSKPPKED